MKTKCREEVGFDFYSMPKIIIIIIKYTNTNARIILIQ